MAAFFDKWRPGNTERRILRELLHQELEIIGLERNVRVEVAHYIELDVVQFAQAGINALHLRGEASIPPFRHADQSDPLVPLLIARDDLVGPIGRTVAD